MLEKVDSKTKQPFISDALKTEFANSIQLELYGTNYKNLTDGRKMEDKGDLFDTYFQPKPHRSNLAQMYKLQKQQDVSAICYKSSSKQLRFNVMTNMAQVNEAATKDDFRGKVTLVGKEFVREQVITDGVKLKIIDGTQKMSLIWTEQGEEHSVEVQSYLDIMSYRIVADKDRFLKELNEGGKKSEMLREIVLSAIRSSGNENLFTEELVELEAWNTPHITDKLQSMALSHLSKVLKQKTAGTAMALSAPDNFRVIRSVKGDKVLSQSELDAIEPSKLQEKFDNKEIYVSKLRHAVKQVDVFGKNYYATEMIMSQLVGDDSTDMSKSVSEEHKDIVRLTTSVRIPTQDKHSMLATIVVDTLPIQYGSTCIVAKETMKLSGEDFDIDKKYISGFKYGYDKDRYEKGTFIKGKGVYVKGLQTDIKSLEKMVDKDLDAEIKKQFLADWSELNNKLFPKTEKVKIDSKVEAYNKKYGKTAKVVEEVKPTAKEVAEFIKKYKDYLGSDVINNYKLLLEASLIHNDGNYMIAVTPATMTHMGNMVQTLHGILKTDQIKEYYETDFASDYKEFDKDYKDISFEDITKDWGKYKKLLSVYEDKKGYTKAMGMSDPHSILQSFKNNNDGGDGIGIMAVYNVFSNMFLQQKLKHSDEYQNIRKINGVLYNGMVIEGTYIPLSRLNDDTSSNLSAFTDNDKEQYAAALGMTTGILGVINAARLSGQPQIFVQIMLSSVEGVKFANNVENNVTSLVREDYKPNTEEKDNKGENIKPYFDVYDRQNSKAFFAYAGEKFLNLMEKAIPTFKGTVSEEPIKIIHEQKDAQNLKRFINHFLTSMTKKSNGSKKSYGTENDILYAIQEAENEIFKGLYKKNDLETMYLGLKQIVDSFEKGSTDLTERDLRLLKKLKRNVEAEDYKKRDNTKKDLVYWKADRLFGTKTTKSIVDHLGLNSKTLTVAKVKEIYDIVSKKYDEGVIEAEKVEAFYKSIEFMEESGGTMMSEVIELVKARYKTLRTDDGVQNDYLVLANKLQEDPLKDFLNLLNISLGLSSKDINTLKQEWSKNEDIKVAFYTYLRSRYLGKDVVEITEFVKKEDGDDNFKQDLDEADDKAKMVKAFFGQYGGLAYVWDETAKKDKYYPVTRLGYSQFKNTNTLETHKVIAEQIRNVMPIMSINKGMKPTVIENQEILELANAKYPTEYLTALLNHPMSGTNFETVGNFMNELRGIFAPADL